MRSSFFIALTGHADTHDGSRYGGLTAAAQLGAVVPSGMIVKPDFAVLQFDAERDSGTAGDSGSDAAPTLGGDATSEGPDSQQTVGPGLPSRYYGRIALDSIRWTRQVADIAEAVVNQIAKAPDAKVRITIEVEADSESGFAEGVQRTVSENAAVLKFDTSEFES